MGTRRYYALVYSTKTGQVYDELPLFVDPTWAQQVNQVGSWSVQTPIGDGRQSTGLPRDTLRQIVAAGRFSVAICYGDGSANDPICQGGPIWIYTVDEGIESNTLPTVTIGGSGFWGVANARLQVPGSWTLANGFGDTTSIATYTSSLQGIAVGMLTDMTTRGALPLDIPAAVPGSIGMTYYGYDMATVGQRLQELTQLQIVPNPVGGQIQPGQLGPDILFQPYFSAPGTIRTRAYVGNPTLSQPGAPLIWDYGSNLTMVAESSDGSALATTMYAKGNGTGSTVMWASAQDSTLLNAGWPLLESIDSGHADVINQATIQGWTNTNLSLYGRPVQTWQATVRADLSPLFGTYLAGYYAHYNVQNHAWLPDGYYTGTRILGLHNGQNVGEIVQVLQPIVGF